MKIMVETNDGFKISEEDFKLRGSGDLFGTKQSGDMNFKFADLKTDSAILEKANNDAEEIIKKTEFFENDEYKYLYQYALLKYEAKQKQVD